MTQQICFPRYEGVPFQNVPPTVDGYVEPEPAMTWVFGEDPDEVDVGWTGASRITYGDATDTGPSGPLVAIQGVSDITNPTVANRRLWLSFIVRRDPSFSIDDRIIIVLHPDFTAGSAGKTGGERRIDIAPVSANHGAGDPDDDEEENWGMTIRHDHAPREVQCFRWETGDDPGWHHLADQPDGMEVRVRSWRTGGGSRNWSVEVAIPSADPGTWSEADDWLPLTDHMGVFADVVRVSTVDDEEFVTQFVWPRGAELDDQGGTLDLRFHPIPPEKLGEAHVGAGSVCSGVRGVGFDGGWGSIGARTPGTSDAPGSHIKPDNNEFVARVRNTGPQAEGVRAEFRIANWGMGPGQSPLWNALDVLDPHRNPTAPTTLPAGSLDAPTTDELTTIWSPAGHDYGGALHTHQCIWVLLSSNQDVDFVRASTKRNMDIVDLSEHDRDVQIDGRGWADDEPGDELDLLLVETQVAMTKQRDRRPPPIVVETHRVEPPPVDQPDPVYDQVFVTVVDGYRRVPDRTLTIDGRRRPIYAYTDSFGQIGVHETDDPDELEVELHGPGLTPAGPGNYRLPVPKDGAVQLRMHMETVRPQRPDFPLPGRPDNWLVHLLRLLVEIIKRIFRRGG